MKNLIIYSLLLFLIDNGYQHYLNCRKGIEIGITGDYKYNHPIFQKICAEYDQRNQDYTTWKVKTIAKKIKYLRRLGE